MKLFLIFFISLIGVGCGGGGGSKSDPKERDFLTIFPETELWGDDTVYQGIQESDKTEIDSLAYGPNGEICYVLREASLGDLTADPSNWNSQAKCLSADNNSIIDYSRAGKGIIKDIVFSNNGEIVIAELVDAVEKDGIDFFFLQLSVYSNTGDLLEKKILKDAASEEELYYYSAPPGEEVSRKVLSELTLDGSPVLASTSKVSLQWHDGSIYLMAYTYGVKLYRFDSSLNSEWDVQVMPAHTWLWTHLIQNNVSFTVNDAGEVFVAFELFDTDADIYEMHFNRTLNKTNDLGDIAISSYLTDGQYQQTVLLGKDEYSENLTGIVYQDNKLWLGGQVRHKKQDATQSTSEWDLFLMSALPNDGAVSDYHLVNFDKEDSVFDFTVLPNGNFIFAGSTGYIQVDSNSQVSNGSGLIVEVNHAGELLKRSVMSEPRNVAVKSVVAINDEDILFSNTYDGPITHTCDSDDSLCYEKAAIGIATLK